MDGIQNFLEILNENWTTILVCISVIASIVKKTINYFAKSKEEKVEAAKAQIKQIILNLISEAELDWSDWSKTGTIKRSQVIAEIYKRYPILCRVVDQEELLEWIDEQINDSLNALSDVIENNKLIESK